MTVALPVITIIVITYMIIKGYKPQIVLLSAGYFLMLAAMAADSNFSFVSSGYLAEKYSTGSEFLNLFSLTGQTFAERTANFGINVMAIAGFARYMDTIGASKTLVSFIMKPMSRFNSPYLMLAVAYIIGQSLSIVITSASGLGMLLMVTLYPVLINMGVSKAGATAVIACTSAIGMGPSSSYSLIAAENASIDIVDYFIYHQLPTGVIIILAAAVAHYIVQKYFDRKENAEATPYIEPDKSERKPAVFALVPFMPIVLLLVFSQARESAIQINLITAVLLSIFTGLTLQTVVLRSAKKASNELKTFFDGMGMQFANVLTLIVAGEIFADGLKIIGFVDLLINTASSAEGGSYVITVIMVLLIAGLAVVIGSGHAPFVAFASLVPDIAEGVDRNPVDIILPMQYASGIMRCVSPISGVVVAVSGISNLSPITVVKRTAIPMLVALAVNIILVLI